MPWEGGKGWEKKESNGQEEVPGVTQGVGHSEPPRLCQRTCLLQTWHCWPQDVGADNSGG